ncbi:hypothetical protein [Dactylosporangium sp. NPDC048998]|uniref:hypothetical protein n=1 Tax=Dactylosporangium sp. NPDC048998 TaxID=3363976 RepID=UPI00371C0D3E
MRPPPGGSRTQARPATGDGTALVNMATRQLIDTLDNRSADSLAASPNHQPGIEVICRDRAGC